MGQTLNLKSGEQVLASIRVLYRNTNKHLTPLMHENTVRFVGDQNGEICFEVMNHTEFDLTIDILNTNKDKINKIDLLKPLQKIIIERNEVLGCTMVFEEYITDRGKPLMFSEERSRCFGEIKIGFDRVFGATASWEINHCWAPITNGGFTCSRKRTETDGCWDVCDGIDNTSRALVRPGRFLEQVRFKETTTSEKFYVSIKYDFGWAKV
jgi:hypothetical protein